MMQEGIIRRLVRLWRLKRALQIVLIALAIVLFLLVIFGAHTATFIFAALLILLLIASFQPWAINRNYVVKILNSSYPELEYSAHLLEANESSLLGLESLQAKLIQDRFKRLKNKAKAPFQILPALMFFGISIITIIQLGTFSRSNPSEIIPMITKHDSPTPIGLNILKNEIIVVPPSYTGLPANPVSDRNISVPEGSKLTWAIEADQNIVKASVVLNNDTSNWRLDQPRFAHELDVKHPALLSLAITVQDTIAFRSPLINLEVIPDKIPEIRIEEEREFQSFSWNEDKSVTISAFVRDDYGVAGIDLVTTISRGSGESVKFSENRFPVNSSRTNTQYSEVSYSMDLDSLGLQPGDELYYFLEARDNREPKPQIGRSETYFLQIEDTSTYEFITAGQLGTEVMPEYFRSQRQIIIDTEKLIQDKQELSVASFNSRSNEIAFDQKALRLRYGQFMGDENEGLEAQQPNDSHESDAHEGDEHEHDDQVEDVSATNTLEDYLHDHGDPESSSFFKVSLKAKLRAAMNEMWDAELQLRLYAPEKSLPYQYRALELLREIKNDSRIYVHRIGYDPPPISPESRLSGELDEITTSVQSSQTQHMNKWDDLQDIISSWNETGDKAIDLNSLKALQNTLVSMAVDDPGRFYRAMELADEMLQNENINLESSEALRQEIISLFPREMVPVIRSESYPSSLLQELSQSEYD